MTWVEKSMAVRGEGDAGSCGYAFGSSTERFQSPRLDRGEAARDNLRGQDINHDHVHCKKGVLIPIMYTVKKGVLIPVLL